MQNQPANLLTRLFSDGLKKLLLTLVDVFAINSSGSMSIIMVLFPLFWLAFYRCSSLPKYLSLLRTAKVSTFLVLARENLH